MLLFLPIEYSLLFRLAIISVIAIVLVRALINSAVGVIVIIISLNVLLV